MTKVVPFNYKYIYFQDTKTLVQLDPKTYFSEELKPTFQEVFDDASIACWEAVTTISGKNFGVLYKKNILQKEHEHIFIIEPKSFMREEMLRKALIAKRAVIQTAATEEPQPKNPVQANWKSISIVGR